MTSKASSLQDLLLAFPLAPSQPSSCLHSSHRLEGSLFCLLLSLPFRYPLPSAPTAAPPADLGSRALCVDTLAYAIIALLICFQLSLGNQ